MHFCHCFNKTEEELVHHLHGRFTKMPTPNLAFTSFFGVQPHVHMCHNCMPEIKRILRREYLAETDDMKTAKPSSALHEPKLVKKLKTPEPIPS